jgi:signal transduction histidine kinase
MVGMLAIAAQNISASADKVGKLTFAITGIGSAHREVMAMRVAVVGTDAEAVRQVTLGRGLMVQQLRLSLPGLRRTKDKNPWVPQVEAQLATVDQLIAEHPSAPTPELRAAVDQLEILTKRAFDVEDNRYIDLTHGVLQQGRESNRLLLVLAAMTGLLGTAMVGWLQRTARHDMHEKTQQLEQALTSLGASQVQRAKLLDDTVRTAERERIRLAAELHDGPIQALAALGYDLDRLALRLERGDSGGAEALAHTVRDDLGTEVDSLRRLMSELRPPVLDQDGLCAAVRDHVTAFSKRVNIDCSVVADLRDGALDPDVETVVYRLVQEALTNVSRHSRASRVAVTVHETPQREVQVAVEDDGIGFDAARVDEFVRNNHFGLAGMRERVEMADGTFEVRSTPGAGTRICANLPARPRPDVDLPATSLAKVGA